MTESKGIYQPWSHEEFMADRRVRRMSPTAVKTYMMLLHEAYICSTRPYLPDDEDELFLMAFCESQEEWDSVKEVVLGMFEKKTVDGVKVLSNKRLERDWAHLQEIRGVRSEAGKKGGLAKASKSQAKAESAKQNVASKEVSKEVREEKEENNAESLSSENNGQELPEDWGEEIMKAEKQIDILTEQFFGKRAFLRGRNGEDLKRLILLHKGSSVERAYGEWCQANQDNPDIRDPLAVFLEEADDILGGETPLRAAAKSPEVSNLVRELSYRSKGQISFMDKHKIRLSDVLSEFTAAEITAAFSAWFEEQDLSDPKNVSYLPHQFVQKADQLCYTLRKQREEQERSKIARDAAAKRLQEEAESARKQAERERAKEAENEFDPFG